MDATYRYDKGLKKHRLRHVGIVVVIVATIAGTVAGALWWSTHTSVPTTVSGETAVVPRQTVNQSMQQISEAFFTMQLPSNWKETDRQAHSISWQATGTGQDGRYLTIYIDEIPQTPVNRELPIVVTNNQLTHEELSDNCATFTPGGTLDVSKAEKMQPTPSIWQGVNFICNLPNVVDNQVGTGSTAGINTVVLTGPTTGTHNYFFLYIDRSAQPDYTILYDLIQSFRAK